MPPDPSAQTSEVTITSELIPAQVEATRRLTRALDMCMAIDDDGDCMMSDMRWVEDNGLITILSELFQLVDRGADVHAVSKGGIKLADVILVTAYHEYGAFCDFLLEGNYRIDEWDLDLNNLLHSIKVRIDNKIPDSVNKLNPEHKGTVLDVPIGLNELGDVFADLLVLSNQTQQINLHQGGFRSDDLRVWNREYIQWQKIIQEKGVDREDISRLLSEGKELREKWQAKLEEVAKEARVEPPTIDKLLQDLGLDNNIEHIDLKTRKQRLLKKKFGAKVEGFYEYKPWVQQESLRAFLDFNELQLDTNTFAHAVGLEKRLEVRTGQRKQIVELTGSNVELTSQVLARSVSAFVSEHSESEYHHELSIIEEAFARGAAAHRLTISNEEDEKKINWKESAEAYLAGKPVLCEAQWTEHSTMTIVYKDRIYICNKGAETTQPGIQCYRIDNLEAMLGDKNLTEDERIAYVQERLFKMRSLNRTSSALSSIQDISGIGASDRFIQGEYLEALKLETISREFVTGQKAGNCSYTNTKRAFDAILLALNDDANRDYDQDLSVDSNEQWPKAWLEHKPTKKIPIQERKALYQQFAQFDRVKSVQDYCRKYLPIPPDDGVAPDNNHEEILLMTLRDKCDPHNPKDVAVAKEICDYLFKYNPKKYNRENINNEILKLPPTPKRLRFANWYRLLQTTKHLKRKRSLEPEHAELLKQKRHTLLTSGRINRSRIEFLDGVYDTLGFPKPAQSENQSPAIPEHNDSATMEPVAFDWSNPTHIQALINQYEGDAKLSFILISEELRTAEQNADQSRIQASQALIVQLLTRLDNPPSMAGPIDYESLKPLVQALKDELVVGMDAEAMNHTTSVSFMAMRLAQEQKRIIAPESLKPSEAQEATTHVEFNESVRASSVDEAKTPASDHYAINQNRVDAFIIELQDNDYNPEIDGNLKAQLSEEILNTIRIAENLLDQSFRTESNSRLTPSSMKFFNASNPKQQRQQYRQSLREVVAQTLELSLALDHHLRHQTCSEAVLNNFIKKIQALASVNQALDVEYSVLRQEFPVGDMLSQAQTICERILSIQLDEPVVNLDVVVAFETMLQSIERLEKTQLGANEAQILELLKSRTDAFKRNVESGAVNKTTCELYRQVIDMCEQQCQGLSDSSPSVQFILTLTSKAADLVEQQEQALKESSAKRLQH